MTAVGNKKNFIISVVYIAILVMLFYAFFKYAFGLVFPFIAALFIAMLLQRPLNFICSKARLPRGIVSTVLVLLCFFVVLSVFGIVIFWAGTELKGFFNYLMIQLEDIPAFIKSVEAKLADGLAFLPDKLEHSLTSFISEKLSILLDSPEKPQGGELGLDFSMFSGVFSSVVDTAKQIPVTLVALLVSVVACCFMTADFASVKNIILSLFRPELRNKIVRSKQILFPALGKMGKAYGLIIVITFCELSLGLFLLKLLNIYDSGYIPIIAIITAIIDIIPVLGTGTVLVPWALYSLITGDYPLGIGLLVIYVCITVIRQIIEPKLVATQLGIPPFATIMAMYIGSRIFGFIGLFLLPITLVMIKMLDDEGIIHVLYKKERTEQDSGGEAEDSSKQVESPDCAPSEKD